MTAEDRYEADIICPQCQAKAKSHIIEEDYYFSYMKDGFNRRIKTSPPFVVKKGANNNEEAWCSECSIKCF